jgi:heme exporter protein D
MTWQDFLHMGGYAFYVWTSYGIAFIVLVVNIVFPVLKRKQFFRQQVLKQNRHNV